MKLICLDTCTRALSVAAMQDGALVSAMWHRAQVNHSVLLMPMLSQMLETLGWDAKDVDFWAAVSGPGSFTGVRIGVSSVRALAHGWKKPVVSVNTLEALAMSFPMERALVVPLLDARRDQVYAAAYDMTSGFPKEVMPPCAAALDDFLKRLPEQAAIRFVGDGATAHEETLSAIPNAVVTPEYLQFPMASAAAPLAQKRALEGEICKYDELEPIYLRDSQAEQSLKKKEAAR